MMIYHGAKDATLNPVNYEEEVKQWSGVFGYDYLKPSAKVEGTPATGHVMTTWGPNLKGVLGANEPHSLTLWPEMDMEWLGLK
jgi:acetylxylan esterase